MKQLLFLFLFPCLAVAQYTGNGGQKITLGEQTTADGLVFRGLAADTTRKPSVDTMAYILLDTNTNIIWQYKKAVNNAWTKINLTQADTSSFNYVNTYGTQTVNGAKTFTSAVTATRFNPTANTVTGTGMFLPAANTLSFSTGGVEKLRITETSLGFKVTPSSTSTDIATFQIGNATFSGATSTNTAYVGTNYYYDQNAGVNKRIGSGYTTRFQTDNGYYYFLSGGDGAANSTISFTQHMTLSDLGELWIGYTADQGAYRLQVNGQIFATNATIATSDEKFKENILPLSKGLEIVNKLKPVTFNFISDTENNFSQYEEVGFIAQDVDRALSTETFAKSIVKAADDSEPTSTMGLATQNLIPILVKAIQEQQAFIKALEQRILILENK